MSELRGNVTVGGTVQRAGETGGRATVPYVRAVSQDDDDHFDDGNARDGRVPLEGVPVVRVLDDVRPRRADQAGLVSSASQQGRRGARLAVLGRRGTAADGHAQELPAAKAVRPGHRDGRVQLGAGRVARVFAHVRPQGTADEARVLLSERGQQTGAP